MGLPGWLRVLELNQTDTRKDANMDPRTLQGKVILITGAARSLGAAFADYFENVGATSIRTDLNDSASNVEKLDVRSREDWETVVNRAVARYGKIDGLVNNAAMLYRMIPFHEEPDDEFAELLRVNVMGPWLGMQVVSREMAAKGGGSIINMSSTSGMMGAPVFGGYGTTRWAVRGMTKHTAADLISKRIRVNSIHPHGIMNVDGTPTAMVAMFQPEDPVEAAQRLLEIRSPLGRDGTTDDLGSIAALLLSDEGSWITGREFVIDGGGTLHP